MNDPVLFLMNDPIIQLNKTKGREIIKQVCMYGMSNPKIAASLISRKKKKKKLNEITFPGAAQV